MFDSLVKLKCKEIECSKINIKWALDLNKETLYYIKREETKREKLRIKPE